MNKSLLKQFGLTDNEIEIFLMLLTQGTSSTTNIAKKTGLNRPYTYYAIERLLEKGYISEVSVRGTRNFQVVDLKQIMLMEESKFSSLKKLLKDLEKIKHSQKDSISVELLKGKFVVKNIFKKMLLEVKANSEVLYLGLDESKQETLEPVYLKKVLNHFEKSKITERIISKKGGKVLLYAKTAKYRFLSQSLLGNSARIIYNEDTIIDLLYGSTIYAVVTKSKELNKTARKQFEVFWKIALT